MRFKQHLLVVQAFALAMVLVSVSACNHDAPMAPATSSASGGDDHSGGGHGGDDDGDGMIPDTLNMPPAQ